MFEYNSNVTKEEARKVLGDSSRFICAAHLPLKPMKVELKEKGKKKLGIEFITCIAVAAALLVSLFY